MRGVRKSPARARLCACPVFNARRDLRWAGGALLLQGPVQISSILQDVDRATVALLDRWRIEFRPTADDGRWIKPAGHPSSERVAHEKIMNNYFGVGVVCPRLGPSAYPTQSIMSLDVCASTLPWM